MESAGKVLGVMWKECEESVGRVRVECGYSVDICWRDCADNVDSVCNECGNSVERVRV